MKRALFLVCAMIILTAGAACAANDMAGDWKASSGFTVHIPDSTGSFTLIFQDFKGEKITHPAQWVTVGKEFTWTDKQNSKHTATLEPGSPTRIKDVGSSYPDSPAYWYKIKK